MNIDDLKEKILEVFEDKSIYIICRCLFNDKRIIGVEKHLFTANLKIKEILKTDKLGTFESICIEEWKFGRDVPNRKIII